MKKYVKPVLGVALIMMALGLLTFWEVAGRELVLMENILVAKEDIYPGTSVNSGMFREVGISNENMISNAMALEDVSSLNGKISNQIILKNSQISEKYFSEKKAGMEEGFGIFKVKPEWIFTVSSSIRKNDIADIYSFDGQVKMGSFIVAFVKDEQGKEVVDETDDFKHIEIIERSGGSGVVTELEIISTLENYRQILEYITLNEGKLIVVNRKR